MGFPDRALFALFLCASLGHGAELRTLSGKTISGDLVQITAGDVVIRADKGNVTVPLPDVLHIELQASTPPPSTMRYTDVELTDGSLWHCIQVEIKGKQVEVVPVSPEPGAKGSSRLQVPLTAVAYMLRDAQDPAVRQEWQQKFLATKGNQDVLAIKKDDVVQRLEGTFGDGDETGQKIEFQLNTKTYQLDLARVHGMVLVRKANPGAPSPLCKVHDVYQNVFAVSKLTVDQKSFSITTVAGAKAELPRQIVARLDFSNDKLAFLSDLEPVRVVEKSSLGRVDHYRRDKNLDDAPLRLAGKSYGKGLALHAYTELVYDLDGKYKECKAVLGVDDTVGGDSQVLVRIDGDGRELFSATVTRKDEPRSLALSVKGVKHLRIVVRSAGIFDLGAHVNLADAQVSK